MLTAHVADAMVRAINADRRGPGDRHAAGVRHRRPATTPTTASTTRSAGTSTCSTAAGRAGLRRPAATRASWTATRCTTTRLLAPGRHPGWASAGRLPAPSTASRRSPGCSTPPGARSTPTGLTMPWYTVLRQPRRPRRRATSPHHRRPARRTAPSAHASQTTKGDPRPVDRRTPNRRLLAARRRSVDEHFTTTGLPVGPRLHRRRTGPTGTAYYYLRPGPVRLRRHGHRQPERRRRRAPSTRPSSPGSSSSSTRPAGKLVIVSSHHTVVDDGQRVAPAATEPARARRRVVGELLAHANVIAWVNGHTHRNQIARPRAADGARRLLGDQHRLPHRLAAAGAAGRGRRQPRRHAVDLHHDARPRRARRRPAATSTARCSSPACRRELSANDPQERNDDAPRHAQATATSSCCCRRRRSWLSGWLRRRGRVRTRSRPAGRRRRRSRGRGCRAPSSGCPWPRAGARTRARRPGRRRSTSSPASG